MPDKVIAVTLQANTANANANIKEVNKSLNETEKSLQNTSTASKNTTKDIGGTGASFSNLKDKISTLPGPLGKAGEGVNTLSSTFKVLLANPIVLLIAAIVAGLTLLYKAFTSTDAGAEKVEQVFSGLGAAIDVLRDRFLKVAGALVKFFTGDFKGALQDGKSAVSGIGEEIATEFAAAAKATATLQALDDELRNLSVSRAKLNADLAEAKEKINDTDLSTAERRKNIAKVREAEAKQNEAEIKEAEARFNALKAKLNSDISDEQRDELAAQEIKLQNLRAQSASQNRQLNKLDTALNKEEAAQRKAIQDAAAAKAREDKAKLLAFNKQLLQLEQQNELAIIKDGYDKELKQLEIKLTNEKKANEDAVKSGQLTRLQGDKLNAELDKQFQISKDALDAKKNEENLKKETDFQKELAALKQKLTLSQITDSRQLERTQLQIGYEEKLNDAITRYKDDAVKFAEVKALIDAQLKADQDKLNDKFRIEDEKKKLEKDLAEQQKIIDSKDLDFQAKRDAIDAEQELIQAAFDKKTLSEEEYNKKIEGLAAARMTVADLETAHKKAQVEEVASTLAKLGDLVGKQTIAGKALGIATALINTYQGASEAIKQKSTLPSPFDVIAKVANVATVIATGLKTVKAITAVQVPGGGGGGGAAPSLSVGQAAPVAPSIGTTQLNQQSLNQMGNATVRAYVVDHDAQTNREKNERLNRAARLGG